MRLFFAAWPDRETRERIGAAAEALALEAESRRVPAENYHMTLAFVGEAEKSQAEALQAIGAALRGREFTMRFDAYEYWPKAEVVVAAASRCPLALEELWLALRADLARHGVALDPRPFRPHVTIARKVAQAPVLQAMSEIVWTAREFRLMRSQRSAAGYTVVDTWPLLDEAADAG